MSLQLAAEDAVVFLLAVAFLWMYTNYVGNRLQDSTDETTLSRKITRLRWMSFMWLLVVLLSGTARQVGWVSPPQGDVVAGLLLIVGFIGYVTVSRWK